MLGSTAYDTTVRELYREVEAERSNQRSRWYHHLSSEEKAEFDALCLASAAPVMQSYFSQELAPTLHGPFARLALEYAAIVRRSAIELTAAEKSLADRGIGNRIVVESVLHAIIAVRQEAEERLAGRWLRELTPEQQVAFDPSYDRPQMHDAGTARSRGQRRRRGRKPGSATATRDTRLYEEWKSAHSATGITKREFIRELGLPDSGLSAIERGRANVKRNRASGRNATDESRQDHSN
jgi:hypothetical protein